MTAVLSEPNSELEAGARYAAFISYAHGDLDGRIARRLHRTLETYTVPACLRQARDLPRRVGKVFRDEDELSAAPSLSERLRDALRRSAYLIVVCSPRAAASRWVGEEINFFRVLGRADRILALLIDGEPSAAFPPALLSGGTEPLAADVRPANGGAARAVWRDGTLRILAAMLACDYDDLRRRQRARRRQRIAAFAGGGALLALIAAVAIGWTAWGRLQAESRALADRSRGLRAQGDYVAAIAIALRATPGEHAMTAWPAMPDAGDALLGAVLEGAANSESRLLFGPAIASSGNHAISPDGRLLVTFESNSMAFGRLHVWDIATGKEVRVIAPDHDASGYVMAMHSIAFSADSRHFVVDYQNGWAVVHDVSQPDTAVVLPGDKVRNFQKVETDATARHLLMLSRGSCIVFDVASRQRQLDCADGALTLGHISADGRFLVTYGNGPATLWDLTRNEKILTIADRQGTIMSAAVSDDGTRLATGGADGSVIIWNNRDGGQVAALARHGGGVVYVRFALDDRFIVTGEDFSLTMYAKPPTPIEELDRLTSQDLSSPVTFSHDGRMIAYRSANFHAARIFDVGGTIRFRHESSGTHPIFIFDFDTGQELGRPDRGFVQQAAFDAENNVITAEFDKIQRWTRLPGAVASFVSVASAVSLFHAAIAGDVAPAKYSIAMDNDLIVRDPAGHEINRFPVAASQQWLANDAGQRLLLYDTSGVPELLDARDGAVTPLHDIQGGAIVAAFQPGGDLLAIRSMDSKVRLWNAATGTLLATYTAEPAGGQSIFFSPDGAKFFVAYPNEDTVLVLSLPRPGQLAAIAREMIGVPPAGATR
jgi:WD40 repeat protein